MFHIASAFYLMHLIIINKNENYTIIYLVSLILVLFQIYKKVKSQQKLINNSSEFANNITTLANEKDKVLGNIDQQFRYARILIKSDTIVWRALNTFHKFSSIDSTIYNNVIFDIVNFYENYGKFLINKSEIELHDLIAIRHKIMNHFEDMKLKINPSFVKIHDQVQRISTSVYASLNRCLRILNKKYNDDHFIAPIPVNLTGDSHELY